MTNDMQLMQDGRRFGLVLPIAKVKDSEEALRLANQTKYGLGVVVRAVRAYASWPSASCRA